MLERSAAVARRLAAGPRHHLGAQPKTPEKVDNKGAEMLTPSSACAWRFLVGAPKVDSLPRWSCPIVRLPQLTVKGPVRIQGEITDKDAHVNFQLDPKSARDMRAKPYDVQLVAGKTYTITLDAVGKGKGLDPFLVVQDPDGKTIAFDDDSGGNLNA